MKKLLVLFILLLAGCSNGQSGASGETIEVTDAQGHTVQAPQDPQRLAVFDFAVLDSLNVLGLSDRVVLTASNPLPTYMADAYAETDTSGSLHEIDLEATMAQEPDLAIVATRSSEAYASLAEYVPSLDYSLTQETTFESMAYNVESMAGLFGLEEEAQAHLDELDQQRQAILDQAAASGQEALMVMYNQGDLSVYGPGGRFGHIHDDFGFKAADENIEAANHGMQVSYEYLIELQPEVIFVLDRESAISENQEAANDEAQSAFEDHPLMDQLASEIYYVTPDAWYLSNGGLEAYQIMLDDVSQALD